MDHYNSSRNFLDDLLKNSAEMHRKKLQDFMPPKIDPIETHRQMLQEIAISKLVEPRFIEQGINISKLVEPKLIEQGINISKLVEPRFIEQGI